MDENHDKIKRRLKIIGIILIVVGAVFMIVGFADFFSAVGGYDPPKLFWMCMIGLPVVGVGISLLSVAYRREIHRYMKDESVPVVNEAGEELKPAVKAVAEAVKEANAEPTQKCPFCGAENPLNHSFCAECGKPLSKICPNCGAKQEADDKFCGKCGAKLE